MDGEFLVHKLKKKISNHNGPFVLITIAFYPITHVTMRRTIIMNTSYFYRVASKAPKLFRISRRE